MTDSPNSLGSTVPALRQIDLRTGAERIVRAEPGASGECTEVGTRRCVFQGTLSDAVDGIVLFSGSGGVLAYSGRDRQTTLDPRLD